jgi:hypothetical protein
MKLSQLAPFFKRRQFCLELDTLTVVEIDVVVNKRTRLFRVCRSTAKSRLEAVAYLRVKGRGCATVTLETNLRIQPKREDSARSLATKLKLGGFGPLITAKALF